MLECVKVKIKKVGLEEYPLPSYETLGAAGCDLRANIQEDIVLKHMDIVLVPTGICLELPDGIEAQIRSRSGNSSKGLVCLNGVGTIDWDYRGELHIPLINLGKEDFVIKRGHKLAQLVLNRVLRADFELVDELEETQRGNKGFGSTGIE